MTTNKTYWIVLVVLVGLIFGLVSLSGCGTTSDKGVTNSATVERRLDNSLIDRLPENVPGFGHLTSDLGSFYVPGGECEVGPVVAGSGTVSFYAEVETADTFTVSPDGSVGVKFIPGYGTPPTLCHSAIDRALGW